MDTRSKIAVAVATATLALTGLIAGTTIANASTSEPARQSAPKPIPGGGAFDIDGKPVDSKTVISDTPPADLGKLEFEGKAVVGDVPESGQFDK